MSYIGRSLSSGNYLKLDDISSSFNSTTTTFNLTSGGQAFYPGSAFSILVSLGGVIQEPITSYTINLNQITFASAPTTGSAFFCIVLGTALGIGVPGEGTVTGSKLSQPFNYNSGLLYLDTANNRIGIGTTIPNEKLQVDGYFSIDNRVSYGTTIATTSSTSQVGIHSALPIATYRSVEYTIQATQGTNFHTTKIIALHDGSLAYPTEYGSVYNTAAVATYDVDVSGGNMRLLTTPASSSTTTYKIIFDAIKV